MKSIIQSNKDECWICKSQLHLEEHHIFGGSFRKQSDYDGLKVMLCHNCHNRDLKHGSLHYDHDRMLLMKQIGEAYYLLHYNKTKEDFIKKYGRNYL